MNCLIFNDSGESISNETIASEAWQTIIVAFMIFSPLLRTVVGSFVKGFSLPRHYSQSSLYVEEPFKDS